MESNCADVSIGAQNKNKLILKYTQIFFFRTDPTPDNALLHVYYSELNFRDVLLASAKLSAAVLSVDDCPEVDLKKLLGLHL